MYEHNVLLESPMTSQYLTLYVFVVLAGSFGLRLISLIKLYTKYQIGVCLQTRTNGHPRVEIHVVSLTPELNHDISSLVVDQHCTCSSSAV